MSLKIYYKILYCTLVALMAFTEVSQAQEPTAQQRYNDLKNITFSEEAGKGERYPEIELTDNSSLSDYLAYAAHHNPELEAAFNRWKAALEKIPQVHSLPDPLFTYTYFIENVETRVGPQRHKFDISQTFPWFGKLNLLGDVALEEANIRKQAYEMLKLELFYKVKEVYYEYYYLSRSMYVTEDNLKLLSYFESVAQTNYTTGKAPLADVIKAQVELGKLEERLLSLRDLREPVAAKLNAVLNRQSDAQLPWPSSLQVKDITLTDDEILQLIVEKNPDLKALEFKIEKEVKSRELAKKQFYPNIMLGLSYVETGPSSMPGTADSGKDPIMTMLSVNLPLWRNKYHAAVRESEILRKTAVNDRENRENILRADLKSALYKYRDAGRKKELYRDTLIPKAKQALNVTQTAFESGTKDFLSLIEAQRTLLEFELSYEWALTNREKFRAQVEMLVGRDF